MKLTRRRIRKRSSRVKRQKIGRKTKNRRKSFRKKRTKGRRRRRKSRRSRRSRRGGAMNEEEVVGLLAQLKALAKVEKKRIYEWMREKGLEALPADCRDCPEYIVDAVEAVKNYQKAHSKYKPQPRLVVEEWGRGKIMRENRERYEEVINVKDNYKYYGEVNIFNKPHGVGTMKFANGDEYVGDWREGLIHGIGKYTFANGESLEGQFENGKYIFADRAEGEETWEDRILRWKNNMTKT